MSTQINLDDSSSWPDDIESLAALADGTPADAAPDSGEEAEPEAVETKDEATEAVAEDSSTANTEVEAKAEATEEAEEPRDIATKDGKGTIPYSALASARRKEQEARARLAELEAQLAEAQKGTASEDRSPVAEFVVTDDMKAKAEKLREEWGDEIADMYLENQEVKHRLQNTTAELTNLREVSAKTAESQRVSEEQQIQDAIDASPELATWQNAEDTELFEKSISMHQFLLNTDPAYAAMDWKSRFQELPKRVKAAYGIASEAPATTPKAKAEPSADELAAKAKAAEKAAAASTPKTMSDLPKGESPSEVEETDKLDRMDGADILNMMQKMSPDELQKYLANVM